MTIIRKPTGIAAVLVLLIASTGGAAPRPGATELVSLTNDGGLGNAPYETASEWPALTPDGRFVAFHSIASNLVAGDTNERADVFLRDRLLGTTTRVSVATDGAQGTHDSWAPRITPDGRYVAFESWASSLHPGDQGWADVFVRDLVEGTTERISTPTGGGNGDESSFAPSITDDGRWVAFDSDASNLVPGDLNNSSDVFLHDRATGVTKIISVSTEGVQGTAFSAYPSISADGRYVAFNSRAANLVVPDTNNTYDDFVYDTLTGTTTRVSVASDGSQANAGAFGAILSGDGRYVAFTAEATNLVPADGNGATWDVFVHDRQTGRTRRVNVSSAGAEANGYSALTGMSRDGRYVLFWSDASNLVPGDVNATRDVFLHDVLTGETELISKTYGGGGGNAMSWGIGSVTPGGRHVGFMSVASNIVPGDDNGGADVFVRDRGPELGLRRLDIADAGESSSVTGEATFSGVRIASVTDVAGEAAGADALGADLTRADALARPESEDLLLRLRLASMPGVRTPTCAVVGCIPSVAGAPGVEYVAAFRAAGVHYEARGTRIDPAGAPPEPTFTLLRCEGSCVTVGALQGSIGTTDTEVQIALPLGMLGIAEGEGLHDLVLTTRLAGAGELDRASLGDVPVPARRVEIQGAGEAVTAQAAADGRFTALVPGRSEAIRARACLGEVCGPFQAS